MKKKDIDKLIEFLEEQFPGCIDNDFTKELIRNIIDYAYREHGHSKGSAAGIISCVLPGVDYDDLKNYLPDFDEWEA